MLSQKLRDELNTHINRELFSSYLYLSMAAYLQSIQLKGMAKWMQFQAKEELTHAMKIYEYIDQRLDVVTLKGIDTPPTKWDSALNVFEDAFKHEQYITSSLCSIVDLARQENDKATEAFIQWFITEQVEEEAQADDLVQKLKMIKDTPGGLFFLDNQLGSRQ